MPNPARYDITTYQGDTFTVTLKFTGDYTSQTPKFEINNASTNASVLELVSGSGITMSYDAPTDKTTVVVVITAAQSAALSSTISYVYDFQFTDSGVVTTYIAGSFGITKEVSV